MQFLSKRKDRKLSGEETGSFLQIAVNPVESIPKPMKQDIKKAICCLPQKALKFVRILVVRRVSNIEPVLSLTPI